MYKRVFMGGTTKGTRWRDELVAAGVAAGVRPDAFFDPTISKNLGHPVLANYDGRGYPAEWAAYEREVKADPDTLLFFDLCPGEKPFPKLTPEQAARENEIVGLTTIWEIPWAIMDRPGGVAVVFSHQLFQTGAGQRLSNLADDLRNRFDGQPPYFENRPTAWAWMFERLPRIA